MLELIHLDFDYQDSPLLNNVTFTLNPGDILHIKGGNGAGKTTLLKLIAGLYQPLSGSIRFANQLINTDLMAYQQQLCFVGHKTGINLYLSVRENCCFDLHYQEQVDLEQLAAMFQLVPYLDVACGLLSAGQRRQVGLLRLWMTTTQLWLLDEPLVALDENSITRVMDKIITHREQGGMVIMTSHQALPLAKDHYREYCL